MQSLRFWKYILFTNNKDHEDREAARKELCRLLKQYVANLNNCKKQCSQAPITVIKIKG